MTQEQIKTLALSHMSRHLSSEWKFGWTDRKTVHGLCKYRTKQILLSPSLEHANKESDVEDVILHEIAHAMTPGAKHGYLWKVACRQLGAVPRHCKDIPEVQNVVKATSKYISHPCDCGKVFHANRLSRHRGPYHCRKCKKDLVFVLNKPGAITPRIAALETKRNTDMVFEQSKPQPIETPKPIQPIVKKAEPVHDSQWLREKRESEERLRRLMDDI